MVFWGTGELLGSAEHSNSPAVKEYPHGSHHPTAKRSWAHPEGNFGFWCPFLCPLGGSLGRVDGEGDQPARKTKLGAEREKLGPFLGSLSITSLQQSSAGAGAPQGGAHSCGSCQVVRKAGQACGCLSVLHKEISLYHRDLLEWLELQSEDFKASLSVGIEVKSSCFRAEAQTLKGRGRDGNFPLRRLRSNFQKGIWFDRRGFASLPATADTTGCWSWPSQGSSQIFPAHQTMSGAEGGPAFLCQGYKTEQGSPRGCLLWDGGASTAPHCCISAFPTPTQRSQSSQRGEEKPWWCIPVVQNAQAAGSAGTWTAPAPSLAVPSSQCSGTLFHPQGTFQRLFSDPPPRKDHGPVFSSAWLLFRPEFMSSVDAFFQLKEERG